MTRNKIMSDDSSDDEFLEYLLDDNGDDDDYYDDDVSLFALVKAYISELSSKNCVQLLCQRLTGMGDPAHCTTC